MRMRHLWPFRLYNILSHYLINGTTVEKETLLDTKCVFQFSRQLLSETFRILRRNKGDIIKKNYVGFNVKYPLFLSDCNET